MYTKKKRVFAHVLPLANIRVSEYIVLVRNPEHCCQGSSLLQTGHSAKRPQLWMCRKGWTPLIFANLSYSSKDQVTIHFINRDGERLTTTAKEGESLLEVVVNHNLAIDGFGACEGTLACSTCHLIFDKDAFQKLDAISDEELDMLDLAYGLTDTSRLGCQVCVKKWMDGLTVRVPMDVSDMRKQLEVGKQSKQ
uniref:2Fe-2S ferredoxin-type domain-containing protein n=1 Tax=Zosterops lateralis melanops TaxID=1220523 RepID=A0A8D2PCQ0_ZOSLA